MSSAGHRDTDVKSFRHVLVCHPGSELYGSDRMVLESVAALHGAGCTVTVTVPELGPLVEVVEATGARVVVLPVPVLRKAHLSPRGLLHLAGDVVRRFPAMLRLVRGTRSDLVYVNTVTLPLWLLAARVGRRPAVCHVHEAEDGLPPLVARCLSAPLLLARTVIVNSDSARAGLVAALPALRSRAQLVYNGVAGPPGPVARPRELLAGQARLVLVGRLSPRKGTDVAVAAVHLLRDRGRDVRLDLVGAAFPGYEWFVDDLRRQVHDAGLDEHVRFLGFTSDVWPALAAADVVLVPSRVEPFGNVAVEAALADRPVVASRVQGLREIVTDGATGVLVEPGSPLALAEAVSGLLDDWPGARRLAELAHAEARRRFSAEQYAGTLLPLLEETLKPRAVVRTADGP